MSEETSAPVEASAEVQEQAPVEGQEQVAQEQVQTEQSKQEAKKEAEVKKKLKQLKIKFNGREFNEELPFEIDDDPKAIEYMTKQLQFAKMATHSAQEKALLEKDVMSFFQQLKENPRKALNNPNFGVDLKKLATEILEEEIANSRKSPEQLKIEEYERKLKEFEEEKKVKEEELRQTKYQKLVDDQYSYYDNEMSKAISKLGLPDSPYVIKKATDYIIYSIENNKDVDVEAIMNVVKDEYSNDIKDMLPRMSPAQLKDFFQTMSPEIIEEIIGEEKIDQIRKKKLAQARQKQAPAKPNILDTGKTGNEQSNKKVEVKSYRDFFGV
jgi:hypothetical protein